MNVPVYGSDEWKRYRMTFGYATPEEREEWAHLMPSRAPRKPEGDTNWVIWVGAAIAIILIFATISAITPDGPGGRDCRTVDQYMGRQVVVCETRR